MDMNELKIEVPQGMVIDTENSSLTKGIIKFKPIEKQLPKTWNEFCDTHPITKNECWIGTCGSIYNYSVQKERSPEYATNVGTRQTCEAVLALMQLIQLRDCYNNGWKPDWNDYTDKFVINCEDFKITTATNTHVQRVLAFKTEELRDKFFENFHDLIETAKELI